MEQPPRLQPAAEAKASRLFRVIGGVAGAIGILCALVLGGAVAVNDASGIRGSLVGISIASAILLGSISAGRNIKLFATADLVGWVGPLGGVRMFARSDLSEIRTVWHWWQGRGLGWWIFPTLHFRRRDTTDAIVTPAIFYEPEGLQALSAYLGLPINLDPPTQDKAA
jgi:hypothetical protein